MIAELARGVYWVGAVDWGIRHFHGRELSTHRGSSYNAYLVVDEQTALIDTVAAPFADDLLAHVRAVMDPAKLDWIVVNHAEPDHAGALAAVRDAAPRAQVATSKRGVQSIEGHFHRGWPLRAFGTGERLRLGARELVFVEAPMLHWPDSMFTYLTEAAVLFSNDAFGQHYATAGRFDDQAEPHALHEEALKYYANILTPVSDLVANKIQEVLALQWPVAVVAPSHGVIWRRDPLQPVRWYQTWAAQQPEPRALIVVDSMWQGTRRMAEAIGDGLRETDVDFTLVDMTLADRNDTLTEVFRARTLVVGSPTLNHGLMPTLTPFLADLKGLRFKNKLGAAFGCYGWSGESVRLIEDHLTQSGIAVIREGVRCQWQPGPADLDAGRAFGGEIGRATRADRYTESQML